VVSLREKIEDCGVFGAPGRSGYVAECAQQAVPLRRGVFQERMARMDAEQNRNWRGRIGEETTD